MNKLLQTKIIFIFLILFCGSDTILFSQKNSENNSFSQAKWNIKPFERKAFIENKGQFKAELPADKINYVYCIDKGYQLFFYNNKACYRFTKYSKSKKGLIRWFETEEKREEREKKLDKETQFIEIQWLNANTDATLVAEQEQSTYYSYVLPNSDKLQTTMCKGYSKLMYKNLYPNIDVLYEFHPENGIKYSLFLHPGADISNVQMMYVGAKKIVAKNNDIHISTIVGDIIDHAPITFYNAGNKKIESSFKIQNNTVSFQLGEHSSQDEITIDPWTVVPGYTPSKAFDNGVDNSGNIYIYGGASGNLVTEKYPPTGGAPIWSLVNGLNPSTYSSTYYGDLLVDGSGAFYICEACNLSGAHTQKFSSTSATLWASTTPGADFREHWRMALNCSTGKVIVAGGGTNYTMNIAEIDPTTGVLSNIRALNAPDDIAGLCVDDFGKSYTHGAMSNKVSFNDVSNNPVGTQASGYSQGEASTGYNAGNANGYNMMTLGGTSFLFTSDGATIKKWDINSFALLGTAAIPGGQANLGSGILADKCDNLFVGASNGVYRFDFNLVQQEYQSTSSAVYDIAYSLGSDIIACGDGFLKPLPFGRQLCPSGHDSVSIVTNPCNPAINTVSVFHAYDNPPYSVFWDDGNTDSVRTNLTIGNHIVTVKSGICNPTFFIDTVIIAGTSNSLALIKNNPLCHLSTDGNITVELLQGQQITSVTWTPSLTHAEPNDSTTKATGLVAGTYSCHVSSSFGCSFDTTVTLVAPPQLMDSLVHRHATCPTSTDGVIAAFAHGGVSPYTYSWDTNPAQTTSTISNLPVGTYHLMISDSNNCKIIDSVIIDSNPAPTADYTVSNPCYGDSTVFTNQSNISSGAIASVWHFGNNNDSLIASDAMYLYPQCNTNYSTSLTVISDSGCVASISKPATVNCMPAASFTANDTIGCEPVCATFQNNPSVPNGVTVQRAWQLGDGGLSSSQTFDHCYNNDSIFAPNYYSVSLIVTTGNGCADTVTKTNYITVYPNPVAAFTADPSSAYITSPEISFINQSVGATLVEWRFGDTSAVSTLYAPSTHTYADTGSYTIQLVTNTQYGCTDTTYRIITIEPDFSFYIPNAFSPNKDGVNDTFNGTGVFIKDYEMRIFDRWGNMIFMTNSLEKPWDGTANGGSLAAQQDVYIYVVNLLDIKNKKHNYRGAVTLVR